MKEASMPGGNSLAIIPPAIKTVGRCCRDPLGIISSVVLFLSGLLVALLDFTAGLFVLPIVLLDLISVTSSAGSAKREKAKFGLPFVKFSNIFGIIVLSLIFATLLLEYFEIITFKQNLLDNIMFELPFPFDILINSKLLGVEMYLLPLAVLLLGKLISACSLSSCVRKNLPKRGVQIFAAILMILSLLGFVWDGLNRMQILPSHYKYCGTELENIITMYTTGAVCFLAAIAVLLLIIKTFRIHTKMRKLKNAFC